MNNKSINKFFLNPLTLMLIYMLLLLFSMIVSPTTGYQQKYIWSKICRLLIQPKNVEEYNEPHDIE